MLFVVFFGVEKGEKEATSFQFFFDSETLWRGKENWRVWLKVCKFSFVSPQTFNTLIKPMNHVHPPTITASSLGRIIKKHKICPLLFYFTPGHNMTCLIMVICGGKRTKSRVANHWFIGEIQIRLDEKTFLRTFFGFFFSHHEKYPQVKLSPPQQTTQKIIKIIWIFHSVSKGKRRNNSKSLFELGRMLWWRKEERKRREKQHPKMVEF